MEQRSHLRTGLLFIGVCVLIGVALFALTWLPRELTHSEAEAASQPGNADDANAAATEPTSAQDAAATSSLAAVDPSKASLGNCHMGSCSWSSTVAKDVLAKTSTGVLLQLSLLGGESDHPDGNYPESAAGVNIKWEKSPHSVWVYCSPVLPAVMVRTDTGLQTDILPFKSSTGVPDVLISSAAIYTDACYSDVPHTAAEPPDLSAYRALPDGAEDISITDPHDIITRAAELAQSQR